MQMEQLRKDMMAAMKARDKERKDAISSLVSAVKKNAIDAGCRDDIPEDMVNATIMKELKTVQEQIDSCPADRTDLLEEYRKRYDIMKEYAPKMLSKEEVTAIVKEKFADVIATKNKGQIMKTIMPELKGKADGSSLDLLEMNFSRKRDNAFIQSVTDTVIDFEYRSRKQAEALERARLLDKQAKQLKKEADKLGKP